LTKYFIKSLTALTLIVTVGCSTTYRSAFNADDAPVEGDITKFSVESQLPDMDAASESDLPQEVNGQVEKWINYFTGRGRPHMERYLSRSSRYLPMMKAILVKNGLPENLVYVALIESGFNSVAHSHAGAVGYWQFIRGTGKAYGLHIDSLVDERKDFILSTEAAAKYLSGLYNLFGSWYLAIAAYNVGENRIKRLVMKHQTRDFWELVRKRGLPRETQDYVPKFIAAKHIAKDPSKFGFTDIQYMVPLQFEEIRSNHAVDLKELAKRIDVDYQEIRALNPAYRSQYAPAMGGRVVLRVPVGQKLLAQQSLEFAKATRREIAKADRGYFVSHKVRRGETLGGIARRYRTSIRAIREANNMGRKTMIRAGSVIKVPSRTYAKSGSTSDASVRKRYSKSYANTRAPSGGGAPDYKVRRGDNLTIIASKFGTSVARLRAANGLKRGQVLMAGKRLKIPGHQLSDVHTVRRGDTLYDIARRYKTSVGRLAQANGLKRRDSLHVGKKLRIP